MFVRLEIFRLKVGIFPYLGSPFALLDGRIKMIVPSLAALLSGAL